MFRAYVTALRLTRVALLLAGKFYSTHAVPFVMGTTGGDRARLVCCCYACLNLSAVTLADVCCDE